MKDQRDKIDEMIQQVLTEEEKSYYKELDEQSLLDMVKGLFIGRWGWMAWMTSGVMLALFGVSVWCAINFFQAQEIREMLLWGAGFFFTSMGVTMIKLWHWMQLDKNDLVREMKKLEFQLAVLVDKIDKS